jgi:hypothetical protein
LEGKPEDPEKITDFLQVTDKPITSYFSTVFYINFTALQILIGMIKTSFWNNLHQIG